MTATTESRAGFAPAPLPPCKVSTDGVGGGGGFSSDQVTAQRRLLAKGQPAERVGERWGRRDP